MPEPICDNCNDTGDCPEFPAYPCPKCGGDDAMTPYKWEQEKNDVH